MSQWKDYNNRSLHALIVKQKDVTRQAKSITEAENVGKLAETSATATSVLGPLNSLIMLIA